MGTNIHEVVEKSNKRKIEGGDIDVDNQERMGRIKFPCKKM